MLVGLLRGLVDLLIILVVIGLPLALIIGIPVWLIIRTVRRNRKAASG
ncbi:MAG TPA: hypothetical protein VHO69_03980 [Phototrophicaceae bacterium]|nr:hypothetical protein [Phototrophicaceae bacterium]